MNCELEITQDCVVRALNSMYWTFSPYLDRLDDDNESIYDYPWIVELIQSYNELVMCLSPQERYEHKIVEF